MACASLVSHDECAGSTSHTRPADIQGPSVSSRRAPPLFSPCFSRGRAAIKSLRRTIFGGYCAVMRIGRHEVRISNPDKPFFPERGLTKGDLVGYYVDVAECVLPHLRH